MRILLPVAMHDPRGRCLSSSSCLDGEDSLSPTCHFDATALLPEVASSPTSLASPDHIFEAAAESSENDSSGSCSDLGYSTRRRGRKALDFSDDNDRVPSSGSTTVLAETPEIREVEEGTKRWPLRRRVGQGGVHRVRHRERSAAYAAALVASTRTGAHLRHREDSTSSQDTSRTSRTSASTPLGQLGGALQVALGRHSLESNGSGECTGIVRSSGGFVCEGSVREAFPALTSVEVFPVENNGSTVVDDSWYDTSDLWNWMTGSYQPGGGGSWDEVRSSIERRSMTAVHRAVSQNPNAYRTFVDSMRHSLPHHPDPELSLQGGWR